MELPKTVIGDTAKSNETLFQSFAWRNERVESNPAPVPTTGNAYLSWTVAVSKLGLYMFRQQLFMFREQLCVADNSTDTQSPAGTHHE